MTVVDTRTGEVVEFDRAAAERRAERITLRLDSIAENYRAVMPMIREAIEKRDDIALGYRSPGEYVADRFGQSLANLGIQVRRAVVAELTEAGLSTRAIAPVVGVSNKTVHGDLTAGVTRGNTSTSNLPDDTTGEEVTPSGADQPVTAGAPEVEESPGRRVEHSPAPRRPVTGLDGKTYTPPKTEEQKVSEAVAEFPDLAYYAESDPKRVVLMADDLRRYREQGELDERLRILRQSIEGDRARRASPPAPKPTTRTCPTCDGRGVIKEQQS